MPFGNRAAELSPTLAHYSGPKKSSNDAEILFASDSAVLYRIPGLVLGRGRGLHPVIEADIPAKASSSNLPLKGRIQSATKVCPSATQHEEAEAVTPRRTPRLARPLESYQAGFRVCLVVGNDFEKPLHLGFDRARIGDVGKRPLVIQEDCVGLRRRRGSMRCSKCGTESQSGKEVLRSLRQPDFRIECPKCGAENVLSSAFCEDCGSALAPNTAPSTSTPRTFASDLRLAAESWLARDSRGRAQNRHRAVRRYQGLDGADGGPRPGGGARDRRSGAAS